MPNQYTPRQYPHDISAGTCLSCGGPTRLRRDRVVRFCSVSCYSVALKLVHGESISSAITPEYRAWLSMKRRCDGSTHRDFKSYGGRGITVCDRWLDSYEAFLADVGRRPSPAHSLDRIDNDDNYKPGNVRWATREEQAGNKRNNRPLTLAGETHCVSEWARITGLSESCLRHRLRQGWPVERTLTTPARVTNRTGTGHRQSL